MKTKEITIEVPADWSKRVVYETLEEGCYSVKDVDDDAEKEQGFFQKRIEKKLRKKNMTEEGDED